MKLYCFESVSCCVEETVKVRRAEEFCYVVETEDCWSLERSIDLILLLYP
jgi:hypothetical protein